MSLLEDIRAAQRAATAAAGNGCPACQAIVDADTGETRDALAAAMAGTIGTRKLAAILREHDIPVGRGVLDRHRKEGH